MTYFDETTNPAQARTQDFVTDPMGECLVLASRQDGLGALIKSKALDCISRQAIERLVSATVTEYDKIITERVSGEATWPIRRKRRDIQRRLTIALLVKNYGYSQEDLKGARHNYLKRLYVNLSKS